MNTNKTNSTRSEKLFFIAAPAMFAVYALLCIYFDNMSEGIFYTTTFIMFVLMLAIIPGFFSFIKAKDKYYAENIRPGIRHSIPGIIVSLTSVITFFSFYLKIPLLIFLIQPLIVLASQYAEDIIFVKDRNKSASAKFSNSPIFGKSFLNQNKKFGYSIHDLSKTSKLAYIAAVFLSVYMALQPVGCLCTVAAIWLILREKAGFSVLAYKNPTIRRIRHVLSILAGIILFVFFLSCLCLWIVDKETLSSLVDNTIFLSGLALYIPVLWLYFESWITIDFLMSISAWKKTTKIMLVIAAVCMCVLIAFVSFKAEGTLSGEDAETQMVEESKRNQEDKDNSLTVRQEQQGQASKATTARKPITASELSKEADALYDLGKYEEALKKYREAYDKGARGDEVRIGSMYDAGQGVVENDSEAVKWYRQAAEQGYASAQFNLGVMYGNGKGVKQDYAAAVKWYKKAAAQGNVNGKFNLHRLAEQETETANKNIGSLLPRGMRVQRRI